MATSTAVLLLFLISAALIQSAHYRTNINDNLLTLAHIIGLSSKQALTFNQKWEAQKIIETLAAEPSIEVASVFNRNNELVAHYFNREQSNFAKELQNPGFQRDLLLRASSNREEISAQTFSHITVYVPVFYAEEYLGTIYIQTNNNALIYNLLWFLLAAMLIFGTALLIAFLLATRLQRQITAPLHSLTRHMSEIIQKGEYPSHPHISTTQIYEINALIGNFTAMLRQIYKHEQALQNYNEDLEQQVTERTHALQESNLKLEHTVIELNHAKDEAISASEAKSRFLANISHEIRTPMIGVLGMAELLLKYPLPADQMELAKTIYTSGDALLALLNDLLDTSKIEAGKLELELAPCSLADTVDTAVEVLAEKAFGKGLDLTVVIDSAIPQEVYADGARLRQIVLNLVSNAIKFTPSGTIVVALYLVKRTESACTVRLEVRDTGIGINPEIRARIFDPFTQADSSTSRQYGGTGLGLAITKQLCALMEGRISISTNTPHGTVFSVETPFDTPPSTPTIGTQWLKQDEEIKRFEFIGIISPNKALVEALEHHFTPLHKKVAVFETAELAQASIHALIQTHPPGSENGALIILDSALPTDCLRLAQEIRARYATHNSEDISLILAYVAPPEWILREKNESNSAADLFIPKPLKGKSLSTQIKRVADLSHSSSRRPLPPSVKSPMQSLAQAPAQLGAENPQADATQCVEQSTSPIQSETENIYTKENADSDPVAVRAHILVAEDQYANQRLVQLLLEQAGYSLTTVDNGHAVLNITEEHSFDLILMDCQMPMMDGYEATQELRRRNISIPIVALTAHAGNEDIQRCTEAGMDDYLCKPFKSWQLLEIVQKNLSQNQGENQV